MIALRFCPRRWLAAFEAAGGRFLIVGACALTQVPTPRAERLARRVLTNRRRWVAVYRLAAALGPAPNASAP